MSTVEVRCPVGPQKLFFRVQLGEEYSQYVSPNLLEISCYDCSKSQTRTLGRKVRVVHRFNVIGELIETDVQEL